MDALSAFSEAIQEFLIANSLTDRELSKMSSCSLGNISIWINKLGAPTIPSLVKISECLDCSIEFLYGKTDDKFIRSKILVSSVSERIKELCISKSITLYRLSKDIGIKTDHIYNISKGKSLPNFYNIYKLAEYFECTIDYLIGRQN